MGKRHLILILAGLTTAPVMAQAEAEEKDAILPTGWSLAEESPKQTSTMKDRPPASARRTSQRRNKPRLIGGARIGNSRQKSRKGAASVGVAVAF